MTVYCIRIFGIQFPVPLVVMLWMITVLWVTFLSIADIRVNANNESSNTDPFSWSGPQCLEFTDPNGYWSYRWCEQDYVSQIRYAESYQRIEISNAINVYLPEQTTLSEFKIEQWYISSGADCVPNNSEDGSAKQRTAVVSIHCCNAQHAAPKHFIANVAEPQPCHYRFEICALDKCGVLSPSDIRIDPANAAVKAVMIERKGSKDSKKLKWKTQESTDQKDAQSTKSYTRRDTSAKKTSLSIFADRPLVEEQLQAELQEKVKQMFIHGYDAYMLNAYPSGELAAVSCKGQAFEPVKLPLVTLIDTLDTLVVMNNYSEFCRAVSIVEFFFADTLFEFDINVSVFETTIRILGGLLSGHMLAVDEHLGIYNGNNLETIEHCTSYDGGLLALAIDLGERLYPAFATATGIPYGTVNLKKGVPPGETTISSTAGAGSLLLEFEVLSRLSGIAKFGAAAKAATDGLVSRRSEHGLYGKHINIKTGKWAETASGIGSNSDSFYEYIIKSFFLFGTPEYDVVFAENYLAVKRFNQLGDWFADVDMNSGQVRRQLAENLQAFWPGVESSLGLTRTSARFLNALYSVLLGVGFMPEEFDYLRWQLPAASSGSSSYLLRPELIESTYLHYRSTHDRSWLTPAKWFLESLETNTRTECGYSIIDNVDSMGLADSMPSYFLAETLKYLYLIFDEDNFIHSRPFIFSTEAHMFDATELGRAHAAFLTNSDIEDDNVDEDEFTLYDSDTNNEHTLHQKSSFSDMLIRSLSKCPRKMWWEKEGCFDANFDDQVGSQLGKSFDVDKLRDIPSHIRHNPHEELFSPPRLYNYINITDYASSFEHVASIGHIGPSCAASDEIFYRLAGGKKLSEKETDKNELERVNIEVNPDYFTFEELRADGNVVTQTLTFEGTADGDFIVDIYTSGFSILSVKYGNLLHIFNLGQTTVFATERDNVQVPVDEELVEPKVQTEGAQDTHEAVQDNIIIPINDKSLIIGEVSGHVHRCHVQLAVTRSLTDFDLTEDLLSLDVGIDESHRAYVREKLRRSDLFPLSEKVLSREMCSPAVFGMTSIESAHLTTDVTAPIVLAQDKIGCEPAENMRTPDNTEDTDFDADFGRLPYKGKILLVERGKCTFEEKANHAQNGGAVGVVVINSENSIFTMGGAAEPEFKIELRPDEATTESKNLFEIMKKAFMHASGENQIDAVKLLKQLNEHNLQFSENNEREADNPKTELTEVGDKESFDVEMSETLRESMKSLFSSAANSALSTFKNPFGINSHKPLSIPVVMVPHRYGKELLVAYNHLLSNGKQPTLTIAADTVSSILDNVMNEGLSPEGKGETGRFPKMKIERDSNSPMEISGVRLWTKYSWGAIIQKNLQGTLELRIACKVDKEKGMLGVGQGFMGDSQSHVSYPLPGIFATNPVESYVQLINKVCDGAVYPMGSKVYIKSSVGAFTGNEPVSLL